MQQAFELLSNLETIGRELVILPPFFYLSKMKTKVKELDIDFIGGLEPMSKEEEQVISEFLKARKLLIAKKNVRKTNTSQQKRVIA